MDIERINERIWKLPFLVKFLIGGIPIFCVVVWIINTQIIGNRIRENFYKSSFSSNVIKADLFDGRTIQFHLNNGLTLFFSPPVYDEMKVGDLIKKENNTFLYDVYRKDISGNYQFLVTYDYTKIY